MPQVAVQQEWRGTAAAKSAPEGPQTVVAGHLRVKNTSDHLLPCYYWPGLSMLLCFLAVEPDTWDKCLHTCCL